VGALGSVERVLVLGIVVVIVAILGIAIWGATDDDPGVPAVVAKDGGAARRTPVIVPLNDPKGESRPAATKSTPLADLNRWRKIDSAAQPVSQPAPASVTDRRSESRTDIPLKPASEPLVPPVAKATRREPEPLPEVSGPPTTRKPVETTPIRTEPLTELPVYGPLPGSRPRTQAKPAEAPVEKPAPPAAPRTHTVASGETLWGIAVRYYGDSNIQEHIDELLEANPSIDPERLYVDAVLTLPARDGADVSRLPAPVQVALLDGRLYEVKSGDTLSSIAQEQLGSASRWREIYELNRERIHDPSMVYVGATLRLPKD
jgi:nucleoid-associated protein YgaU